ncbi:MAG: hypothetical protein ACE15E_00390 [Acidobacteriota bacterium]
MGNQNDTELMLQAISEAQVYNQELSRACVEVHTHFQLGQFDEGIALLKRLLEGLGTVSEAIQLTHPVQAEKGLSLDLSALPLTLKPLVEALEHQDYGLAGDIVCYELRPLLDSWSAEFAKGTN